jgi:hypothetical protein
MPWRLLGAELFRIFRKTPFYKNCVLQFLHSQHFHKLELELQGKKDITRPRIALYKGRPRIEM